MSEVRIEPKSKMKHEKPETAENQSLKGTLVSVFILGAIILISWFGVFSLFLSRN